MPQHSALLGSNFNWQYLQFCSVYANNFELIFWELLFSALKHNILWSPTYTSFQAPFLFIPQTWYDPSLYLCTLCSQVSVIQLIAQQPQNSRIYKLLWACKGTNSQLMVVLTNLKVAIQWKSKEPISQILIQYHLQLTAHTFSQVYSFNPIYGLQRRGRRKKKSSEAKLRNMKALG